MKSLEGREKDAICKYLDSIGAWYCKPATYGFGKSGTPDIVGCYRGRFFGVEVKREGKEPTALQNARIQQIRLNVGVAVWGTAEKVIEELRNRLVVV